MRKIFYILLIFITACNDNDNYPVPMPEFSYTQTTARGVKVRSTVNVPVHVLGIIDNGIQDQFDKINPYYPQWNNLNTHTQYKLDFVNAMAVDSAGCPALLVQGINAAGTVYGVRNDGLQPTIVLPHQQSVNWRCTDLLRDVTFYESEHLREWANDQRVFYFFATGQNDVHPHNYKLLP